MTSLNNFLFTTSLNNFQFTTSLNNFQFTTSLNNFLSTASVYITSSLLYPLQLPFHFIHITIYYPLASLPLHHFRQYIFLFTTCYSFQLYPSKRFTVLLIVYVRCFLTSPILRISQILSIL